MAKLEYKILIVRDEHNFPNYDDWFASNSPWDQASFMIQTFSPSGITPEIFKNNLWHCIVWDSKVEVLRQLQIPSLPIVILVAQTQEILGLNYLLKVNLTKELLISVIHHQIIQTQLQEQLNQSKKILEEQALLKHKLQLEQSVNLLLQSIHSSFDLSSIFTAATTGIGKLLKLDRVEITQYLPEQGTWQPVIEYRSHDQIPSALGTIIPDQDNQISGKLKQGEIVAINSYAEINCSVNQILYAEYPGSWLMVPLVVGSDVWGAISMDCHQRTRHWLSAEVDLAINISTQLAIAIQQCKFYHKLQVELQERQEIEQSLRDSEEQLSVLISNLPGYIYRVRNDQNYTPQFISEGVFAITGYRQHEYLVERTICSGQKIHPEDFDMVKETIQKAVSNHQSFECEYRIFTKIGDQKWVWERGQGIYDKNGDLVFLEGFVTDISELKSAQMTLQSLVEGTVAAIGNDFFSALVNFLASSLHVSHALVAEVKNGLLHTRAFWSNHAIQPNISYDIQGSPCNIVLSERMYVHTTNIQQDFPDNIGLQTLNADSYLGVALTDSHQKSIGVLCILDHQPMTDLMRRQSILQIFAARASAELEREKAANDLHRLNQDLETRIEKRTADLRRSKEILQISEQRFRSFFTLAPIGIAVADARTFQLVAVNQAYCQFLGYTEDELLKIESVNSITEPADWALEQPLTDSMIKGEINSYQLEQKFIKKSAQIVIGEITATKISDLAGNVTHIIKMVQDITDRKRDKEALNRSKELLRLTIENTPIGILTLDLSGKFLTVNQDACRIFGYSSEELLQITTKDITHPDSMAKTIQLLNQIVAGELVNAQIEKQYIHKSGKIIDAISRLGIVRDEDGNPLHFVAGVEDITDRKRTEKVLNQQFERQNFITKITQQIRQSLDLEEVLTAAVNEVSNLLKCDRIIIFQLFPHGTSQVVKEIVKPEFPSIFKRNWQDEHFSKEGFEYYINSNPRIVDDVFQDHTFSDCLVDFMTEAKVKSKIVAPIIQHIQSSTSDRDARWCQGDSQLWGLLIVHSCGEYRQWQPEEADLLQQVANQLAIAIQQADLYQQVQQELLAKENLYQRLTSELSQKEILLKEIHHRVKNNLQVMSSLLRLQFRKTTPEVKALCEEYQNRIQSMALIHDQLHRSNDLANIDFYRYITNLTTNLFQCYGANSDLLQLHIGVKDIYLPLDQSIPLGLIINELVSNALKYAFPDGYGKININLTQSEQLLHLTVADNGIGIPESFDLETTDSLGMQLVYSLTDQLEGEVMCDRTSGTKFDITFPIVLVSMVPKLGE